ncbi:hypothetical protein [Armatimonas sp.]|uniref:hypothetical protein n=1 Tax=Armatimonas sp. TaxID=1872638 RepID=UPI003753DC76
MSTLGGGPVSDLITPGQKLLAAPGEWVIYAAGPVNQNQTFIWGMGEKFTVGSGQSITVSGLGIFVDNGAATNGTATVKVWNMATSTAVAGLTATFGAGPYDLVAGSYRAIYVTPVVLGAGTYMVSAAGNLTNYNTGAGPPGLALFNTLGGKLTWNGSYYGFDTNIPPENGGNAPPNPINFGLATLLAS